MIARLINRVARAAVRHFDVVTPPEGQPIPVASEATTAGARKREDFVRTV